MKRIIFLKKLRAKYQHKADFAEKLNFEDDYYEFLAIVQCIDIAMQQELNKNEM